MSLLLLRDGTPVAVHRTASRRSVAHLARCPRCGCMLDAEGDELRCAMDGSRFAAATGAVLGGPAAVPLPRVDVRVRRVPWFPG